MLVLRLGVTLDQHVKRPADLSLIAGQGDALLERHQLRVAGLLDLLRQMTRQGGAGRSGLKGIGERAHAVKLQVAHHPQ